jgi:hypothetical protein
VSVAVGERHDLTNDLDYRIPHRLDTETRSLRGSLRLP